MIAITDADVLGLSPAAVFFSCIFMYGLISIGYDFLNFCSLLSSFLNPVLNQGRCIENIFVMFKDSLEEISVRTVAHGKVGERQQG